MAESKSTGKGLTSKFLSWPVVCVLFAAMVITAYFQVPQVYGCHEGYLFTLAGYLSASSTIITGSILERLKPGIFSWGKFVPYRFWLAGTSVGTLLFWIILRAFPVPVWDVKPVVLLNSYALLLFGSLLVAWLISRGAHSKTSVDPKQSK